MERVEPPLAPLQVVHASTFATGLVALMAAAMTSNALWYLVSGPLIALSGVLILAGWRITFRGPIGDILRAALGPKPLQRSLARGVIWLLIGVLVSVWGVVRLRTHPEREELREPIVMS